MPTRHKVHATTLAPTNSTNRGVINAQVRPIEWVRTPNTVQNQITYGVAQLRELRKAPARENAAHTSTNRSVTTASVRHKSTTTTHPDRPSELREVRAASVPLQRNNANLFRTPTVNVDTFKTSCGAKQTGPCRPRRTLPTTFSKYNQKLRQHGNT